MTRNRIALMAARDALREAHRDLIAVERMHREAGDPACPAAERARAARLRIWAAYEAARAALEGDEGRG